MLTGADPSCGSLAEGPVRRAGKHKTLYVIARRWGSPAAMTFTPIFDRQLGYFYHHQGYFLVNQGTCYPLKD
jgi:hypothetical protein